MLKRHLQILIFVMCVPLFVFGQSARQESHTNSLQVFFHKGKSHWDPEFQNNEQRLKAFVADINHTMATQKDNNISKINIVAGASPEGSYAHNQRLSRERAACVSQLLQQHLNLPKHVFVEKPLGVDWEGLYRLVEPSNMPYRDEVLDIIKNTPELDQSRGRNYELRRKTLERLHGGEPWQYMYDNFFPILRGFNMNIVIEWEKPLLQHVDIKAEPTPLPIELKKQPLQSDVAKAVIPPYVPNRYFAIKTNMLIDALAVPNIGVEAYLGKQWSIAGNWMYSWWKTDRTHWYWRTYGGDLEVRRWFGSMADEKPLQGWHAGLYGGIVTYDFETGGRGYLGDRWSYFGGVSIGYSMPIKRRLNIDFTLGVGYLGGEYKEYIPDAGCYVWQATKQRHWFGPTKLEVSLVWLIGHGNINKDK